MKQKTSVLLMIPILLLCGVSSFSLAHAQSGSFIVRPAKVELSGSPGETVQATISLENQLGVPATFGISFEDVAGSENPNDPVTLLGIKRGPYPLRDLLRGPKAVTLSDKGEKRISISVTIPTDASPGGLYGSVIFTPEQKKVDGNVVPNSRIGVLIFLRVEGELLEEGGLRDFSYEGGRVVFGKPRTASVVTLMFENTGTVHLSPYGTLTMKTLFGEPQEIPIDPWYVLPKSARNRTLEVGDSLSYGPQTLSLDLHRGYGDKTDTQSLTVWVFPTLRTIGIAFAILAVLLVLLFRRGRNIHVV